MNDKKIVCAITGPTYAGKTTLSNKLINNCGFLMPKQTTTRCQRIDDIPDYYRYISVEDYNRLKANNNFLLCSGGGNLSYGILKEDFEDVFAKTSNLLLNISYENIDQYLLLTYKKILLTLTYRDIPTGIINRIKISDRQMTMSDISKRIEISDYLHKAYFSSVKKASDSIIYTDEVDELQTFELARKIITKKKEE